MLGLYLTSHTTTMTTTYIIFAINGMVQVDVPHHGLVEDQLPRNGLQSSTANQRLRRKCEGVKLRHATSHRWRLELPQRTNGEREIGLKALVVFLSASWNGKSLVGFRRLTPPSGTILTNHEKLYKAERASARERERESGSVSPLESSKL